MWGSGCGPHCAYRDQSGALGATSAVPTPVDEEDTLYPVATMFPLRRLGARLAYMCGRRSYSRVSHPEVLTVADPLIARHYALDANQLDPVIRPAVAEFECGADPETQAFLDTCKPSWVVSFLAGLLRPFMSVTDVNGLLNRGKMYVLGRSQMAELLHSAMSSSDFPSHPRLLDVGAGDGGVTQHLQPFFTGGITATEVSWAMVRRLKARGYTVVRTPVLSPEAFPTPAAFDVVSIFNVLDRCDHPADLLRGAIRLLKPRTGRLVLAVVLPFSEFVEDGPKRRGVIQPLPMRGARCHDGATFEASLSALITRVLLPLGLQIERIARVPYLCQGDSVQPYYVLSDAIICARLSDAAVADPGAFAGVWAWGAALPRQTNPLASASSSGSGLASATAAAAVSDPSGLRAFQDTLAAAAPALRIRKE